MLTNTLSKLFSRDLNALIREINLYKDEKTLWIIDKEISNSAGNLCLHLVGNLNYFIGEVLGDSGYKRQKDLEFSLKDISKSELIKQVNDTITVIGNTLQQLTREDLQKKYKLQVFKTIKEMTVEYFLIHLSMHLAYHLGQVNYHRRLLDI